jgi:DNA-binding GntR family transcriptional regulator
MTLNTLDYNKIGDLAYRAIRDAIISGGFQPNERLNQDELAKRLGVSRAPVRDALNRLEAEGLVRTLGRIGGVVVAEASEQQMVDIYELRAVMDAASARFVCERASDDDLARLQAIVDETERATEAGDLPGIVQGHAAFHEMLYEASGNAELIRVARNLWDRSYRFRVMALSNTENARRGLAQHRAMLVALRDRDPERAVATAEEHNRSSIRHLRSRLAPGDPQAESGSGAAAAPDAMSPFPGAAVSTATLPAGFVAPGASHPGRR